MTVFSGIAEEVEALVRERPFHQHLPYLYLEAKKARTILELGIYRGYSTRSLLYGLRDGKQGHLWSIDWGKDPDTPRTVENIRSSDLNKYFTWIKRDITSIPDSWFEKHKADLVHADVPITPRKRFLNKYLLSLHKGSKMLLFGIERNPEKTEFLNELDTGKYRLEPISSKRGVLGLGAVWVIKE